MHSPGLHDGRYWKESELVGEYIDSNLALFAWTAIVPFVILGQLLQGICARQKSNGECLCPTEVGQLPYGGQCFG